MYERESGTYSPMFCFRNTSAGSTYRFLPSVKHTQVTSHLFSLRFFRFSMMKFLTTSAFRASLHGGGGPQVGEVTRQSIQSDGGVTYLGGLPGLLGGVTLSVGVTICYVNVSRWGNPPGWGGVHVTQRLNEQNNSETRVC